MATRYRYLMVAEEVPSAFVGFVPSPDAVPILYGDTAQRDRLFIREVDGDTAELVTTNIAGDADYIIQMKDTAGTTKWLRIFGQNTSGGGPGGKVQVASGSGVDSQGVEIAERVTGHPTNTNTIVQYFAQGGTLGQTTLYGGSNSLHQMLGTGLSVIRIGSNTAEMILDAGTDLFIRVSNQANTIIRGGPGQTLAFHGTAPQAKQTVTGSRGGNAALASLLTALATIGLLTDSSS